MSTNIAESSVTIEGIVYVIDCGFLKVKYYDYFKNMDALLTIPESKANAMQRAGRAGRTRRRLKVMQLESVTIYTQRHSTIP